MPKLTYLGPEGTFTQQAARDLARQDEELVPLGSVREVVQSVESGEAAAGVVAFENSLEGPVPANLDELLLQTTRCMISGERVLPVSFTLFRTPGDDSPLKVVTSHAFGLAQCSRFIEGSGVEARESPSTAGACRDLAESPQPGWGAIGPPVAGEMYGLEAAQEHIEDDERAATRFILLRTSCPEPTGKDRSAFSFRPTHDEPGSLVRLLQEFALREINLTAIKSRPTKELLGEYIFYIECEGHIREPHLRDAVLGVLRFQSGTRYLGSFPEDAERPPQHRSDGSDASDAYDRMLGKIES
ncbi:MAG TPA: prephenate dehydratase [Thermoleophilaceae bacterium]|jgi:prephenate dehydratase